ncbi:MAG: acetyl/propionyl/methylcrotonyl-CoA carboxylase subunit alpha [Bdellovibrionales bacterium]
MSKVKIFKRIAIANRGEVAVRVINACKDLGIETILLHSDQDVGTRAYRMADYTVSLKGNTSAESYLDISKNISAALSMSADAVHPGFGFLSENADFAEAVIGSGMSFIGPMPKSIREMGDKISAKKIMEEAGVPTIPGYKGSDQNSDVLLEEAKKIGFPVLIKAAAGGGGRGMKVSRSKDDFLENLSSAQREGDSAFGSPIVFLEKYLESTKHIEVQVFGDTYGNHVHLFERECSVQRRHQKIIEEAPSPSLNAKLRGQITDSALKAAKAVNYIGAGTVEFLLEGEEFYFLEMNTRLQVEHPVTELITSTDLVKAQIKVAQGSPLDWAQSDIIARGHSIECRIYAEDPYKMGMPSTGKILKQDWPYGPGARFEYAFEPGDEVSPLYDPMIAKVVTWDEDRSSCINKTKRILSESIVFGVKTNFEFLKEILGHNDFREGTMFTSFIESYFPNALESENLPEELAEIFLGLSSKLNSSSTHSDQQQFLSPFENSWRNV